MSKLWQIGIISLSVMLLAHPAKAGLIGPSVTARANASDGTGNVAWFAALDAWKVPGAGEITGFQYYKAEAEALGSDGNLRFMVMHLTSGNAISPNISNFEVLYVSDPINTTGLVPGAYSVGTSSPVPVVAGDLIGFFGRGVSFTIGATSPVSRIVYSNTEDDPTLGGGTATHALVVPTVGSSFQVKPTSGGAWGPNDYNWYTPNGGRRTYSLAADFAPVPEPTSLALVTMAGIGALACRRLTRQRRQLAV